MKIGVTNPVPLGNYIDLAVFAPKAESLGFESIWVAEHSVMPVTTTSPFPWTADGAIPPSMAYTTDPFMILARASAVTTTLKLGTGICLLPERNPLLLAKVVATLDHMSGGRVILGIGAGWLKEQTEVMGGNFPHRWGQSRESVLAMKELWTKEESEFHGKYYDFPPVRSFPKPFQKPHPPVILGGTSKNMLKRVVGWGDGWMPTGLNPEKARAARAELNELATNAGRDPSSIKITAVGQPPDKDVIKRMEDAGVDRVIIGCSAASTEEATVQLEVIAGKLFG